MRAFLLALVVGCASSADEPAPRVAAPGEGGGDSADPVDPDPDDPGEDPEDTGEDTTTPAEPSGCEVLSASRSRCGLLTAADWAAGDAAGVEAGDALRLAAKGLVQGVDSGDVYNGGSYWYGEWTSAELAPGVAFDGLVPSWNADTPPGTWIALQVQARVGGAWTGWYRLGVWASGDSDVRRHSFEGESDSYGRVWTDTLSLDSPADAARIKVTLFSEDGIATPEIRRLTLAVADTGAGAGEDAGGAAWGTILDVPGRSQMEFDEGEAWCSPTSTSMILAWWASETGEGAYDVTVPAAAAGTWDHVYEGNGNWPFNVAYAASLGLAGEVGWLDDISDIEPWIAAGVPVAISAAWDPGDIDGAPISSTDGHLLVVTGFTAEGDVAVNDPASSSDEAVDRIYDRRQIEAAWLGGSGGIVYLIWPE